MREATVMSHIQHTPHGQCCCCARASAAQAEEPEPFRFSDVPSGQWLVGSLMILAIVITIAVRHL
ncbi:hypothetical protein [Streptomyces sp. ITFR-6]|uniref:hypothetical protein n=1 Tax=Streptomyces sp. ITFR-6 TaxID=3075197 RepID=UPI002889FBFE|nr:hypothetical protein [Streptomyces sp. ITFR-6]WNI31492.1 hypothetical protein RLT59_23885 [Streptomyces sp. ITFR-6]